MSSLRTGWQVLTLGEVASWGSGGTPKSGNAKFYGGSIPWAIISDLNDDLVTHTEKSITHQGLSSSSAKVVLPGTILIAMYGSIGKMGIAGMQMATNQAIAFATANPGFMDQKFLYWYLRSQRAALLESGKGATQQNISQTVLKAWPVPVPPLDEQVRIVSIIEDQVQRTQQVEEDLDVVATGSKAFRESVLHAAFSGGFSPEGVDFKEHTLGDIAKWGSGGTPTSGRKEYYGGEIPWCVIGDLTEGLVLNTRQSITELGLASSSAKIVPEGTILLAMYGASIGRTGVAGRPMATNQAIACGQPNLELVHPDYLLLYLQSQKWKFIDSGKGGAQPNISQTIVKSWPILLPDLQEQKRLVDVIRENLETGSQISDLEKSTRKNLSAYLSSLLYSLFLAIERDGTIDV